MVRKIKIWLGTRIDSIKNSIAFYPAIIAILFLLVSFSATSFDFSEYGKHLKSHLSWFSLKDATTARSIITTIIGGLISLTVFSFSLVMIILNQTASQMSNRILKQLIGNRFQQVILGNYIGTIVFALYLLSTIRDIDSGIYIPSLSTYLLILVTIMDIFLFIYFLHYITQSIKYEVIISRITNETLEVLKACSDKEELRETEKITVSSFLVKAVTSGVYEGCDNRIFLRLCQQYDVVCKELHYRGSYLFEGMPFISINKELKPEAKKELAEACFINNDESVDNNFFYGFRQLTEVAVKALSPGINDPATAVQALRALIRLFIFRMQHLPQNIIKDRDDTIRIYTREKPIADMFAESILPIWDYGKKDRIIQNEMHRLLLHLTTESEEPVISKLLSKVEDALKTMENI